MKPTSLIAVTLLCASSIASLAQDVYKDASQPVEARVKDIVSKLTLDEKLQLIVGVGFANTHAVPRLGIPEFRMTDGPFGVRDNDHNIPGIVYAGGLSLASSFDTDMANKVGVAYGRDCRSRGINIVLGPGMNILRAPFSGRNFEYFGEDPLVDGDIAAAYSQGLRSQGVAATIKHFVCNDQEFDRDHISSDLDERTLREIYLKPFEIAVKKGGALIAMDSYNPVNGVHMTENNHINNEILKGEWGFQGFIMSDWWALGSTLGSANGGLDLEMPGQAAPMKGHPRSFTPQALKPLIDSNQVTQATIDDKVARIFRVVFTLGWLDKPQQDSSIALDDPQNEQVALDGAREGIVLLKNQDNLLPLDPGKVKKIVVWGHNAEMAMAVGGGSAHANYAHGTSLLDGLKDVAPGVQVVEVPWQNGGKPLTDLPQESLDDIKSADAVIACVGFNDYVKNYWGTYKQRADAEGEGMDRTYNLPNGQEDIIQALAKLNPKTIVVLNAGGGVETESWIDQVPALLDAFYSGQSEGQAAAEILFGKTNPSAKLPFSWEKKWADGFAPAYGNFPTKETPKANTYAEGVFVGYRWFDSKNVEPLFPFGFGLSYTSFAFSNLAFTPTAGNAGIGGGAGGVSGNFTATFTVQNTGKVAGSEVAELYVAPPSASVSRPVHELKGFARVTLQPGETETVSIPVSRDDLAYWDPDSKKWTVTAGSYEIQVGDSSRNLPLKANQSEP